MSPKWVYRTLVVRVRDESRIKTQSAYNPGAMMSSVIQFARPRVAKGPLRFTKAAMQAVQATLEYGADLEVCFGACDDGDEWCLVHPAGGDDRYPGFNGTGINVDPQGFTVESGTGETLGVFEDIHEAIAVARRDVTERIAHYEPANDLKSWLRLCGIPEAKWLSLIEAYHARMDEDEDASFVRLVGG